MSALPLDLDLEDLEAARDQTGEAILDLVEFGTYVTDSRQELVDVIFKLGAVRDVVNRAIDACRDEAKEEPANEVKS